MVIKVRRDVSVAFTSSPSTRTSGRERGGEGVNVEGERMPVVGGGGICQLRRLCTATPIYQTPPAPFTLENAEPPKLVQRYRVQVRDVDGTQK